MKVILDTGPIIALAKVKNLKILKILFGNVHIPNAVYKELMAKTGEEAIEIDKALKEFIVVEDNVNSLKVESILKGLGAGEKKAIIAANSYKGNSILIIDDKAGRSIAKKLNIKLSGTVGIILQAKEKGLIKNASDMLNEMRNNGYWLSDIIVEEIKKIAKE